AHRIVSGAKRSADNDRDLWYDGITDRIHQLGATANDPAPFRVAPDHETSNILKKNDWQACLIAIHDKARCLIGAVGINNTAHLNPFFLGPDLQTLVGDNSHRSSSDARICCYDRLAIAGF